MFRSEKMVVSPGWEDRLRTCGWTGAEAIYRITEGVVVTRSNSTEVRRLELNDGAGKRTVFIKKYWAVSARQLWSGALRGTFFGRSKARREFDNLNHLRAWGLDAPPPVAFGEERHAGWLVRSFLISEGVPEATPLDVFIRDFLPGWPKSERRGLRTRLIQELADHTRRMHERRFVHHDYFWRNILLNGSGLEHFWLIDAHKGRKWRPWAEGQSRAKDLATLDAPAPAFFRRTDRLRFFLRYAGHTKLTDADRKLIRLALRLAMPLRELQLRRVLKGREIQPEG